MTSTIPASLLISVPGVPIPQGSHKAFVRGNRAIITNDNRKTAPWKDTVANAAIAAKGTEAVIYPAGPVRVDVTFVMPRPKGHYGTGRNAGVLKPGAPRYPETKPDADKLARLVGDALTAAAVWRDDSQVAMWSIWKIFCSSEVGNPRAEIRVSRLVA